MIHPFMSRGDVGEGTESFIRPRWNHPVRDETEVLNASHDMSWPIYAFPGTSAVTAEPTPGASRRDGDAWEGVETVRSDYAADAAKGEVREG